MFQTLNPILRSIEKKSASQGGAHDSGVDGSDAMQSQASLDGGCSEGSGQFASRFNVRSGVSVHSDAKRITYDDIVTKTVICLSLVFLVAVAEVVLFDRSHSLGMAFGVGGVIAGLTILCVLSFKEGSSMKPYALGFAVSQGLFVGLIVHALLTVYFIGYIIGPYILSFTGIFLGLLFMYKIKILRKTHFLNRILFASLTGISITLLGILIFSLAKGTDPLERNVGLVLLFNIPITIYFAGILAFVSAILLLPLTEIDCDREKAWEFVSVLTVVVVWSFIWALVVHCSFRRILALYDS